MELSHKAYGEIQAVKNYRKNMKRSPELKTMENWGKREQWERCREIHALELRELQQTWFWSIIPITYLQSNDSLATVAVAFHSSFAYSKQAFSSSKRS